MSGRALDYVYVANSMAIARLSESELETHRGEFAVLVDGKVQSYHKTNREAVLSARATFTAGGYSVQRIEPQPVDVGFVDRADYPR